MNFNAILTAPETAIQNKTDDYVSVKWDGRDWYTQEVVLISADGERRLQVRATAEVNGTDCHVTATLAKLADGYHWEGKWKTTKAFSLKADGAQKLIDRKVKEFKL